MKVVNNENYIFEAYSRKENSPYEYENIPYATFKGRPANQYEKKNYRIMSGIQGNTDSIYIVATNLPAELNIKDRVKFLGKFWTIESMGFYFENDLLVNPSLMSDKYIEKNCPKGLSLQ